MGRRLSPKRPRRLISPPDRGQPGAALKTMEETIFAKHPPKAATKNTTKSKGADSAAKNQNARIRDRAPRRYRLFRVRKTFRGLLIEPRQCIAPNQIVALFRGRLV